MKSLQRPNRNSTLLYLFIRPLCLNVYVALIVALLRRLHKMLTTYHTLASRECHVCIMVVVCQTTLNFSYQACPPTLCPTTESMNMLDLSYTDNVDFTEMHQVILCDTCSPKVALKGFVHLLCNDFFFKVAKPCHDESLTFSGLCPCWHTIKLISHFTNVSFVPRPTDGLINNVSTGDNEDNKTRTFE